jgi:hypothetical protein
LIAATPLEIASRSASVKASLERRHPIAFSDYPRFQRSDAAVNLYETLPINQTPSLL